MSYPISFNKWVRENQPPETHRHSHRFWEVIGLYRDWQTALNPSSLTVVGNLTVRTPLPYQSLTLPLVRFDLNTFEVDVAYDFSLPAHEASFLIGVCALACRGQTASALTMGSCGSTKISELARSLFEDLPILRDPDEFDSYDNLMARAITHFRVRLGTEAKTWSASHIDPDNPGVRCIALRQEDALTLLGSEALKSR